MQVIINLILYQAGWLACVLGAARGLPWLGLVAGLGILGWHLAHAAQPARELALIGAAAIIGTMFETLLILNGWVRFDSGVLIQGLAPYWMVALWVIFATTLNVSLRMLRPHLWLAAICGATGAPFAYYAGAGLGAMDFGATGPALVAIGVGWAILTPALLGLARRLDGYARA